MNVTVVSTFDRLGGAAEAAFRHVEALRQAGVNARMLVRTASEDQPWISQTGHGFFAHKKSQFLEWSERLRFIPQAARREDWFSFSFGTKGQDIIRHPWIQDADVINPHWVQKSFISISELARLSRLGKYMIWHLQDMWAFTGGCHYSGPCRGFTASCGNCLYLKRPNPRDLSAYIHTRKTSIFNQASFQVSASSKWLQQAAKQSSLFKDKEVFHLPMGVNTQAYTPGDQTAARIDLELPKDGIVFLFVAMNANDQRKGFRELTQALSLLTEKLSDTERKQISLAVLGKFNDAQYGTLPFKVHILGFRSNQEDILKAYRASDLFILPSLEDNLPNTVLEAMSCGTPVIGFHSGGVPEMIDHNINGLLAESANPASLADALHKFILLSPDDQKRWKNQARMAMEAKYSYHVVAKQHVDHYQKQLGS